MTSGRPRPMRSRSARSWSKIAVVGASLLVAAATLAPAEPRAPESTTATAAAPGAAPHESAATRAAAADFARALSDGGLDLTIEEARTTIASVRAEGRSPIGLITSPTALRESPDGRAVAELAVETEFGSPTVLAVTGQDGPWLEVMAPQLPNGVTGWVHAYDMDLGGTDYSLHANLAQRSLEVHRGDRVVRTMSVAIGAPDTPTPPGTYAVTDKLEIGDAGSPYGCCALAFTGNQPNVPQEWEGGDRLAVHGTSAPSTVGSPASLGCLRAAEDDMRWMVENVPLGTPVEIAAG